MHTKIVNFLYAYNFTILGEHIQSIFTNRESLHMSQGRNTDGHSSGSSHMVQTVSFSSSCYNESLATTIKLETSTDIICLYLSCKLSNKVVCKLFPDVQIEAKDWTHDINVNFKLYPNGRPQTILINVTT